MFVKQPNEGGRQSCECEAAKQEGQVEYVKQPNKGQVELCM